MKSTRSFISTLLLAALSTGQDISAQGIKSYIEPIQNHDPQAMHRKLHKVEEGRFYVKSNPDMPRELLVIERYDNEGRIVTNYQMQGQDTTETIFYSYNDKGLLVEENRFAHAYMGGAIYHYDDKDNLISKVTSNEGMTTLENYYYAEDGKLSHGTISNGEVEYKMQCKYDNDSTVTLIWKDPAGDEVKEQQFYYNHLNLLHYTVIFEGGAEIYRSTIERDAQGVLLQDFSEYNNGSTLTMKYIYKPNGLLMATQLDNGYEYSLDYSFRN